jgi:hypothetical protein
MNVLTDTFRGLVRRRLWPVALLLLGALAAVPMLLSKPADPAPVPVAPVASTTTAAADPVGTKLVTVTEDPQGGRRRYVLGARKDPFAPAPLPKVKHKKAAKAEATPTPTPAPSSPSSPSSPSDNVTPPVSAPPVAPKPRFPAGSVTVRFGDASATPTKRLLERDHALPSSGNPVLVYMGLKDHGKTAVFMLGADVAGLEGDGTCDPDPAGCESLELKAGETEFITLQPATAGQPGVQYELDLERIHK